MNDLKAQNELSLNAAKQSAQGDCDAKVRALNTQLQSAQSQVSDLTANVGRIQTLQQTIQSCQNQVSNLNSQKLLLEQQITSNTQNCDKIVEQRNRYAQILINLQNRLKLFQRNVLSAIQTGDNANNQQIRTVLQQFMAGEAEDNQGVQSAALLNAQQGGQQTTTTTKTVTQGTTSQGSQGQQGTIMQGSQGQQGMMGNLSQTWQPVQGL